MAERSIGSLFVNIVPGTKEFSSVLSKDMNANAGKIGANAGKSMGGGIVGGLKKMAGPIAAAISVGAAINFGKELIRVGEAAATSDARIAQINESMGLFGTETEAVNKRITDLARTQAMATGMDINAIKQTQAKLLTFKDLASSADTVGGAFDRATAAAIDLEAAGFGAAEQQAVALGKALNDPTKGLTALSRSGITFTETEKAKIEALQESGDLLGAQEILLQAIEAQVSGTAAATANSTDKLKQGWLGIKEQLAGPVLKAFDGIANIILEKVFPFVSDLIEKFQSGEGGLGKFAETAGELAKNFFALVSTASPFGILIKNLLPVIMELVNTLGPVLISVIQTLMPVVTQIAQLVGEVLKEVFIALAPVLVDVAKFIGDIVVMLMPLIQAVLSLIAPLVTALKPILMIIIDLFKFLLPPIMAIVKILVAVLVPVITTVIEVIKIWLGVVGNIYTAFRDALNNLPAFFKGIFNKIVGFLEGFINFFIDGINSIIGSINKIKVDVPDWARGFTGGAASIGFNIPKLGKASLPRLAEGGVVMPQNGGVLAQIAEAGEPEAVIPLDKLDKMLSGGGSESTGVTVNVYPSKGMSEKDLADAVGRRVKWELGL